MLLSLLLHFSCEEILLEVDISDASVVLLAPANNVELPLNSILFDWEKVDDATAYEIQIATPNFDNAQQLSANTTDSITSYEISLNAGEYQWRVRAKNSSYETAYTKANFKVVPIVNFSDFTVLLNAPTENLITNEADQNLQWGVIDGATLYRIQVVNNGAVVEEMTTENNTADLTFTEGNLSWQIRAENGTENTLYSSRNILVDTTIPNTPTLNLPANEAVLTLEDVSFEWTRAAIEGSAEFDTISIYRDAALTDLVLSEQVTSPFESTLTAGTYYWFVKAQDEAGNQGDDSSVFSFTIN